MVLGPSAKGWRPAGAAVAPRAGAPSAVLRLLSAVRCAHKGPELGNAVRTQGRDQAVVCGVVLRNSVPCVRNRDLRAKEEHPLPCWWSRVVRGWASCCGHDVLPLSSNDPGGVVTCGSRALVTADKGNGPLCVRPFAGVGAGLVVHWLALTHATRGGRRDGYRGYRSLHRYRRR